MLNCLNQNPINNSRINTIYKYRSFADNHHLEMFAENYIYFANPSNFNDPYDCKIPRNWFMINEFEVDNYIGDWIENNDISKHFNLKEKHKHFLALKNRMNNRAAFQKEEEAISFQSGHDHYGVFCATTEWNNLVVWSNYADYHRGFAVGYNLNALMKYLSNIFPGLKSGPVNYVSKFPHIKPVANFSKDYAFNYAWIRTHTKYKLWKFENEYRILITIPNLKLSDEARKVMIPNTCITNVILGSEIKDKDKIELINICKTKNIAAYQAQRVSLEYQLELKQIL